MPYIATLRVEKHTPPRQRGPDNHWGDRQRQVFRRAPRIQVDISMNLMLDVGRARVCEGMQKALPYWERP